MSALQSLFSLQMVWNISLLDSFELKRNPNHVQSLCEI